LQPSGNAVLHFTHMHPPVPLAPYLYTLGAYLALQVLLNQILRLVIARQPNRAQAMLIGTFWAGVANAAFLVCAAAVLHYTGAAPNAGAIPEDFWLLALYGLPAGFAVWYVSVWARKLGLALFGRGELIASEDAILRLPPHPRYLTLGLVNLTLLQPLGRESFFRGALFPAVAAVLAHDSGPSASWLWAIAIIVIFELLLRMNIVWVFQTVAYALMMCVLFILTGYALTGLVAAMVSGFLHGVALAYTGQRDLKQRILRLAEEDDLRLGGEDG
jgi:hypothetical protein